MRAGNSFLLRAILEVVILTCSRASIRSRRRVRQRRAACLFRSRRTRRFSNSSGVSWIRKKEQENPFKLYNSKEIKYADDIKK